MNALWTASNDPAVLNIKKIATEGGGRGELYDQGVLDTIAIIERDESFTRNRMVGLFVLYKTHKDVGNLLTDEEVAEAESFMHKNGWSFDQAFEYIGGVDFVERMLRLYEERSETSDD